MRDRIRLMTGDRWRHVHLSEQTKTIRKQETTYDIYQRKHQHQHINSGQQQYKHPHPRQHDGAENTGFWFFVLKCALDLFFAGQHEKQQQQQHVFVGCSHDPKGGFRTWKMDCVMCSQVEKSNLGRRKCVLLQFPA